MRYFVPATDDEIYAYIERYGVDPEAIDPADPDPQPRAPRAATSDGRRIDD